MIELDGGKLGSDGAQRRLSGRARDRVTQTIGPPTDDQLADPSCPTLGWNGFYLLQRNGQLAGYLVVAPSEGGVALRTSDGIETGDFASELFERFGEGPMEADEFFGAWFELPSGVFRVSRRWSVERDDLQSFCGWGLRLSPAHQSG